MAVGKPQTLYQDSFKASYLHTHHLTSTFKLHTWHSLCFPYLILSTSHRVQTPFPHFKLARASLCRCRCRSPQEIHPPAATAAAQPPPAPPQLRRPVPWGQHAPAAPASAAVGEDAPSRGLKPVLLRPESGPGRGHVEGGLHATRLGPLEAELHDILPAGGRDLVDVQGRTEGHQRPRFFLLGGAGALLLHDSVAADDDDVPAADE